MRDEDRRLERAILDLLVARAPGASICPSEAARVVDGDRWKSLTEPARSAARRLAGGGLVEITQQGRAVDPSTARGAIRVRMKR